MTGQANRDLSDLLSHDRVAGHNLAEATCILAQVAKHLHYLHVECKLIHGDIKSRNLVEIILPDGTKCWILIDLDAACPIDQAAGQKVTSNAFFPPEMARYALDKVHESPPKATEAFEIFYFGLLVFHLCTQNAETLWKTNQADEMVDWATDSHRLAYRLEEGKLEIAARILQSDAKGPRGEPQDWSAAADLALWCLQPRATRRPQCIKDVLDHPFFGGGGSQGHFKIGAEPLPAQRAKELHVAVTQAWTARALEFHQTIASARDSDDDGQATADAVRAMLNSGDVNYTLPMTQELSDSAQAVRPLHRAVMTGKLAVVRTLVDDIHPKALSSVLNMRTQLGLTVLHWACFFNHGQIVNLLLDRPKEQQCDTSATNYRGKTAWDVAEAAQAGNALQECEDLASLDEADPHFNLALRKEKQRRERRPTVDETELDLIRFTLWCTAAFSTWKRLAEGAFGQVFLALFVSPAIEVSSRQFHKAVIKVLKAGGVEELKGEVEELGKLEHINIVLRLLGMCYGPSPGSEDNTYMSKHTSNQPFLVISRYFVTDCL